MDFTTQIKMMQAARSLNDSQTAELFGTTRNNITIHLSNIFEKELSENSVCKEFLHTARDGKNYKCI